MASGFLLSRRRPSYRLPGVESVSATFGPGRRLTSIRALASFALLAVGVALSGCGGDESAPAPPSISASASSGSVASPSTERERTSQREGFDDALAQAGLGDLPAPVSDTLATLASNVCAAGGGESQKSDRIEEILPVAESVASLVPDTDARQVADTVYDAGLENFC